MTKWTLLKWTIDKQDAKNIADREAKKRGSQMVEIKIAEKHRMKGYQIWIAEIVDDELPEIIKNSIKEYK